MFFSGSCFGASIGFAFGPAAPARLKENRCIARAGSPVHTNYGWDFASIRKALCCITAKPDWCLGARVVGEAAED